MLTSLAYLRAIPTIGTQDTAWLNQLLGAVDAAVKSYCKQNIELAEYTEYHSGDNQRDIVLRQFPVINDSTLAVYLDPTGYFGQSTGGFGSGTILTKGGNYVLVVDGSDGTNTRSRRGLIRRIAGTTGTGFIGFYPEALGMGKLSAYRAPIWPRGDGNLKVVFNAGWDPVPADLQSAVATLVGWQIRNMPQGVALNNESLGSYSYSVIGRLTQGQIPELGEVSSILRYYRELSF